MHETTDVLIVGAGPTGLTLANELTRRGVSCRIIEKRAKRSTRSKALAVHARTLEQLDLLGLSEAFVQLGYTSPGFSLIAVAQQPLRVKMHQIDSAFPYVLILPQADTEMLLEENLKGLGNELERDSNLTDFRDCGDHIEAVAVNKAGEERHFQARYIVGCDGANSRVREVLGIPFEGSSLPP